MDIQFQQIYVKGFSFALSMYLALWLKIRWSMPCSLEKLMPTLQHVLMYLFLSRLKFVLKFTYALKFFMCMCM